jgi:hypothetical protein
VAAVVVMAFMAVSPIKLPTVGEGCASLGAESDSMSQF